MILVLAFKFYEHKLYHLQLRLLVIIFKSFTFYKNFDYIFHEYLGHILNISLSLRYFNILNKYGTLKYPHTVDTHKIFFSEQDIFASFTVLLHLN